MSTASRICLAHLSWDILFTWPNRINVAEICLVGEVARSSGFYKFHRCAFVAKCHTVNSSKNFQLCRLYLRNHSFNHYSRLYLRYYSFSHYSRFMTICKNQNKDQFKTDSFAVFERPCFVTTER